MSDRTGHPRTLQDHDDWRLRAVQKQSGEDTDLVAAKSGLRVATVVKMDPYGHIMIDAFYDPFTDTGSWFRVLNFTQPLPGESVLWGYVNGSPTVLGPLTSPDRPWVVPLQGMPDTFFFDDFDVGSVDDALGVGISRWTYELSSLSTTSLSAGDAGRPGLWTLSAASGDGQFVQGVLPQRTLHTESLNQIEFMVEVGAISLVSYAVGLNDGPSAQSGIYAYFDTAVNAAGWVMQRQVGGVLTNLGLTSPAVPAIAGHKYRINFLNTINDGEWRLEVVDVSSDPPVRGTLVERGFPQISARGWMQSLNRGADGVKNLIADYVWWSRRQLARV